MRRKRPILQTLWHVKPAQSVFVQNKRRIAGNRFEAFRALLRLVLGSLCLYETGDIDADPFLRVPPHQFFPFTPGTSVRPRTGTIVNDAAITRPTEAPAMAEIIFGFPYICLVHAIATENAGVNPAAARGRTIVFEIGKAIELRAVMRPTLAIDAAEEHAIGTRLRFGLPAVYLSEHGFHFRLAMFVLRIPPIERAQRFVDWIVRLLRFRNQSQREVVHEPAFGSAITRRIDRFLTPLQKPLCIRE